MTTPTKKAKKGAKKRVTNTDAPIKDEPQPIQWTLAEARKQVAEGYTVEAVVKRTGFSANQIKFGVKANQ
jgi:hypothetical protein